MFRGNSEDLPITTFDKLAVGDAFQIIWTINVDKPSRMPEPPPETIFTKLALRSVKRAPKVNAIFRSDDPEFHNMTIIPDEVKVLKVSRRYAITVAEGE